MSLSMDMSMSMSMSMSMPMFPELGSPAFAVSNLANGGVLDRVDSPEGETTSESSETGTKNGATGVSPALPVVSDSEFDSTTTTTDAATKDETPDSTK
eukprot:11641310-Ditylum_brightwellii.AAC.1